jgi:hypothetical protein
MKYIANLLVAIHNVATPKLGARHEGRLPPQLIYDQIRIGAGNSRVVGLRAPVMVRPLRRPDDEGVDLAEGHGRDRWLRAGAWRADTILPRRADLCGGSIDRLWCGKHCSHLRGEAMAGSSGAGAGVHGGESLSKFG